PELELFQFQRRALDVSRGLLAARKRPRLEFFVQGGYGRPALNMLENEFKFYYIGGLRLSWLLSGYYTFAKEKQLLNVRQQSLDVQQETFLFNTRLTLRQEQGEVEKLRRLIEVDDTIIALRARVKETASVQLEQGVISASDYVREVNAEDRAIQDRVLHEVQLLMAQARYEFTNGH
ncbi:MAG TPA: transporter, partial [Chryseosolibacter sp.]